MSIEVKQLDDRTEYLKDGLRHRDGDLPAFESADGTKSWYKHGKLHRETGPAIECANGYKSWFVNGIQLTEEEFNNQYGFDPYDYAMGLL